MSLSKLTCRSCGATYWDGDPHTCPYNVTCPRCGSVYLSTMQHNCMVPAPPPVPPSPTLSPDAQAILDVLKRQLGILQFFFRLVVLYLVLSVIAMLLIAGVWAFSNAFPS